MTSEAATPEASGTPMSVHLPEHVDHPVDGCPRPCCRITFTDHLGVVKVWSWTRAQWEAER